VHDNISHNVLLFSLTKSDYTSSQVAETKFTFFLKNNE
jgi:hypothetical protein